MDTKSTKQKIITVTDDKRYVIRDIITGQEIKVTPKAVESCMNPGTFHVTPIEVTEDEKCIYYRVGEEIRTVDRTDIEKGNFVIEELAFWPSIIRRKGGCNPCTNCGRCSW